ncbi:MAG: hypothetical protein U0Q16_07895 [Bryobacteraceae bacterium]
MRSIREQPADRDVLAHLLGFSDPEVDAEKLRRLDDLLIHIDTLIAPADLPKFLLTPNPVLDGFPPSDLIQSGFAYRRLVELVEKAKSGEYS